MARTAPAMTIEENLAIAYSRNKKRRIRLGVTKQRRKLFQEFLKTLNLGLENRLNARVGLLSGGERQALSLLRSEEHTSELQSRGHLVCRLLLEKNNQHADRKL